MRRTKIRPTLGFPRRFGVMLLLGLAVAISSCAKDSADPTAVNPDISSSMSPILTGAALSTFVQSGQFTPQYLTRPGNAVSEERATQLATLVLEEFGLRFSPTLERDAGRSIDLKSLVPTRVFFAESPYRPLGPNDPIHLRALFAPAYVVMFEDGQGPAVLVTVSVHTQEFSVEGGKLIWPREIGNQFRMRGIAESGPMRGILSPEEAARVAASRTTALVAAAPTFVWWGYLFDKSTGGSWRVTLDRNVQVLTDDGSRVLTSELYVDNDGSFRAAVGRVPLVSIGTGETAVEAVSALPRQDDLGSRLVPVTLVEGGAS